jgi:hypothetical protein
MKNRSHQRRRIVHLAVIVCSFLLLTWSSQHAEAKGDSTVATSSFLRISSDARGTAMGNAQGAVTNDVYAMYWNPAGLANVLFNEVGVTYQRKFQGLNYSFIGYAVPTDYYGTIGMQLIFLSSGYITSTYENPDGSFGGTGDSFLVADLGLGISQSKEVMRGLSYGLSAKVISHKIMDEEAFSLAADAGVIYQTLIENISFGIALQNLSTRYKFMNQRMHEPWNLRFAVVYDAIDYPLILATDYNLVIEQRDSLNLGLEYRLIDLIALRAGVRLPAPAGFLSSLSAGFGINLRDLYRLDYSFSPHTELGTSQRFSILVRF